MEQQIAMLLDIKGEIGLLHGKMDGFLSNQKRLERNVRDHDQRIGHMEKTAARRGGMIAVIAAVATLLVSRGTDLWSGV